MEPFWIVIICYAAIGLIIGLCLAVADWMTIHEPGEKICWVPLAILLWPILVGLTLRDRLKSKR